MEGPIAVYTEDPHDGTLTLRATLPEAHVAGAVPQCGDTLCAHWDPAEPSMLEVRRRYLVPEPATAGAPPPGTFALVVAPRPATRGERPLLRGRAAPEALTAVRLHRAMAATLPALLASAPMRHGKAFACARPRSIPTGAWSTCSSSHAAPATP